MKIPSKSILSPGRNREPSQISLSTSLSRRLRSNGSIKGGQASPMFPTVGKRRGCAFENTEPSSPKVTCIGQVRVKTKKHGKKLRARSKRRGEASFRRTEQNVQVLTNPDLNQHKTQPFHYQNHQDCLPHRNQRWAHLPVTICEALRTFGADLNCFLPCRSSCMSSGEREKDNKASATTVGSAGGHGRESSCGAVFGRWLVVLQDGDGKGREIDLGVGEEDKSERSQRRHVFDEIEIKEKRNEEMEGDEEEMARVSICIPPKNALLLMRCRSDPVKMAALANRFWDPPPVQTDDEEEEDEEVEEEDAEEKAHLQLQGNEKLETEVELQTEVEEDGIREKEDPFEAVKDHEIRETEEVVSHEIEREENIQINGVAEVIQENKEEEDEENDELEGEGEKIASQQEETVGGVSSPEEGLPDPGRLETELEEARNGQVPEEDDKEDCCRDNKRAEFEDLGSEHQLPAEKLEALAEKTEESPVKGETEEPREGPETVILGRFEPDNPTFDEYKLGSESKDQAIRRKPDPAEVLPDCLLLMMCEPKLSMEVSKETWVCSKDFIRWLPERPVARKETKDETKKRIRVEPKPPLPSFQPPRSSCSLPAAAAPGTGISMANMIEQKLVGSNAYEPFVLTRCKSEPMRSSSKSAPTDGCFWKNRKLEPHRPASLGIGAAGF